MRNLKTLAIITLSMGVFSVNAQSSDTSPNKLQKVNHSLQKVENADMQSSQTLEEEMNFTADQKTQLKAIKEKYSKMMEEVQNNENPSVSVREELQNIREEMMEEVNSILTPEQREKLNKK